MTISAEAARHALALALATPLTGRLKPRHSRSDFGGEDSHLLKVRRIGRDYPCGDNVRDGDFGFYLGRPEEDGEPRRQGDTKSGPGKEIDGRKMGRFGRRWENIFLPSMFLPASSPRRACATPSGLAMGAGPLTQGTRPYRDPGLRCATPSA